MNLTAGPVYDDLKPATKLIEDKLHDDDYIIDDDDDSYEYLHS
jgi:hypothetical protein